MSKREKTINDWLTNTPKEESLETVLAIVKYYFDSYRQTGSHVIVKDAKLDAKGLSCTFAIKGGQKVKAPYLQNIANIIKHLES